MERDDTIRVLIVEDDPVLASALKALFEDEFPATAEIAGDCASARERLSSSTYEIITLDHLLPDGNGLELLAEINAMEDPPPVIMVTGHGDEQTAVESFKLGASGYVVKDERLKTLLPEAVGHALSGVALEQAREEVRLARDKLEATLDALPDLLFEVDREGRIYDYRSPRDDLLYVPPEEFLGKTVEQVLPGEAAGICMDAIDEATRTGRQVGAVYSLEMPSGVRWFELSVSTVGEQLTLEGRLIVVARDITERKRAEEALREELSRREELESIIKRSPAVVFLWRAAEGWPVEFVSENVRQLGYTPEDFYSGRVPFADIVHPEDLERVASEVDRHSEEGVKAFIQEYRVITGDGDVRWVDDRTWVRRDANGDITHYQGIILDITERKRAENLVTIQRDLAVKLSGISGFHKMLEVVMEAILDATVFDCGGVYLVNDETGAFEMEYTSGLSAELLETASHYDSDSPNAVLVREGKSLFINHEDVPVPLEEVGSSEGLKAFGMVPIFHRDRVIGCLNVASHTVEDAPEESRTIALALAGQIGEAVSHSRLVAALTESEERHRLVYEFAGEAIYSYNRDLVLTGVNRTACEMIGYSAEELVGKHALETGIVHPDDVERVARDIERLFSGETVVEDRFRFLTKDGVVILVYVVGAALYKDGEVYEIVNIAHDITERTRAQEELEEERAFVDNVFDSLRDVLVISDLEGNFVRWNRRVNEVTGYSDEELEKMDMTSLFDREGAERAARSFMEAIQEGGFKSFEVTGITKSGKSIPYELKASLIKSKDGDIIGLCGLGRDITERKEHEEQLERINRELEGYAHTVSHDLKSPLTGITLALEMLTHELGLLGDGSIEGLEDAREKVAVIRRSAVRVNRRIDDLLVLAETGQVPGEVSEVDVTEVVSEVLEEMAGGIEERGAEVKVGDDLGTVTVDPTHVHQVFSNLIGNAIRHNERDGIRVEISCLGDDPNGGRRYRVRDNGEGILPEDLEKVFTLFFRGKNGGTGIGLSTVEKIVKVYGGEIEAYNDNGACFEFVLPGSP